MSVSQQTPKNKESIVQFPRQKKIDSGTSKMYFPIINRLAIWGYMTRCNIAESNLDAARGYRIMNWNNHSSCFSDPSRLAVLFPTTGRWSVSPAHVPRVIPRRFEDTKIVAKHLTINSVDYRLGTFSGKVLKRISGSHLNRFRFEFPQADYSASILSLILPSQLIPHNNPFTFAQKNN